MRQWVARGKKKSDEALVRKLGSPPLLLSGLRARAAEDNKIGETFRRLDVYFFTGRAPRGVTRITAGRSARGGA